MVGKYKVVTLCGSTRFKEEFMRVQKELTLKGIIVISVGLFSHAEENSKEWMDDGTKIMLDDMHKRKIDMADEIFVINPGGYIGSSTQSEIEYAKEHKKVIRYLEHPLLGKWILFRREGTKHLVIDVNVFDEDTFNQGDFAVTTMDGKYLYACEIEVLENE